MRVAWIRCIHETPLMGHREQVWPFCPFEAANALPQPRIRHFPKTCAFTEPHDPTLSTHHFCADASEGLGFSKGRARRVPAAKAYLCFDATTTALYGRELVLELPSLVFIIPQKISRSGCSCPLYSRWMAVLLTPGLGLMASTQIIPSQWIYKSRRRATPFCAESQAGEQAISLCSPGYEHFIATILVASLLCKRTVIFSTSTVCAG